MDNIKELTVREQCRDKLSIFFGSKDNNKHGYREVMNNAIDEVENNFDEGIITVELFDDMETLSVEDTGRGVTIDVTKDNEKGSEVLLFEKLFAGTNFDNAKGDKKTTGVNGSGTCVLNHTSSLFKVNSYRNGNETELIYSNGGLSKTIDTIGNTNKHGSKFTFRLDETVYPCIKYNYEEVEDILRHNSATANNINFILKHKDNIKEYKYETLEDYFDSITSKLTSEKIVFPLKEMDIEYIVELSERNPETMKVEFTKEKRIEKDSVKLILSTSPNNIQESYLNHNYLPEGGTINDGVLDGIKNIVNDYCKKNKMFKGKIKTISREDIQGSLCFVCDFRTNNVEFTNQTKYATKKLLFGKVMRDYITEFLSTYIIENEKSFKKIVEHILSVADFNNKTTSMKNNLKKKLSDKAPILNKIPNLYEAESKEVKGRILCICEGKSALSSLLIGKGKQHAIYPLRGKILNCLKASPESIFNNEVIKNLMMALGCGVEFKSDKNKNLNNFNEEDLRYEMVYVFVDADVDGIGSIMPLLLTMFYVLTPTLIKQKRIRICKSPKYEIDFNDKEYFAVDDEELEQVKNDLDYENNKNKINIHYIKGLSELSSNAMSMCLGDDYKNIEIITLDDIEKSSETIELFMDTEVKPRKEYILNNFDEIEDNYNI